MGFAFFFFFVALLSLALHLDWKSSPFHSWFNDALIGLQRTSPGRHVWIQAPTCVGTQPGDIVARVRGSLGTCYQGRSAGLVFPEYVLALKGPVVQLKSFAFVEPSLAKPRCEVTVCTVRDLQGCRILLEASASLPQLAGHHVAPPPQWFSVSVQ